jgi:hypothetical protein
MSFKGSVRSETGQAVENLWMTREFPVEGSSAQIFFSATPVGGARRGACVCAFVTRFA